MDEAQIKAMQEENERLKKENGDLTKKNEELTETVAKKDEIIEQKNQDIIGARRKYKTLDELTDEEKANLTDEERARKEEMDTIYQQQEEDRKKREEERTAEVESRRKEAARKLVGDNEELQKKILANYDSIKGSENAHTVDDITKFMGTAANMLGEERPDPLRVAQNGGSGS